MNKTLIHRDNQKIKLQKEYLKQSVKYVQHIYSQANAIGSDLSLKQIQQIAELVKPCTTVQEALVKLMESELAVHLTGTPEADLTRLCKYVIAEYPEFFGMFSLETGLMVITDSQVTSSPEADELITARFSYYSAGEGTADLVKSLKQVCDALNSLNASIIKLKNPDIKSSIVTTAGIEFVNSQYRPDLSFIRDQEILCTKRRVKTMNRSIR